MDFISVRGKNTKKYGIQLEGEHHSEYYIRNHSTGYESLTKPSLSEHTHNSSLPLASVSSVYTSFAKLHHSVSQAFDDHPDHP